MAEREEVDKAVDYVDNPRSILSTLSTGAAGKEFDLFVCVDGIGGAGTLSP